MNQTIINEVNNALPMCGNEFGCNFFNILVIVAGVVIFVLLIWILMNHAKKKTERINFAKGLVIGSYAIALFTDIADGKLDILGFILGTVAIIIFFIFTHYYKTKELKFKDFEEKCICHWSKDDEYGFISNTECPAHGKATKKFLSKCVEIKFDKKGKIIQSMRNLKTDSKGIKEFVKKGKEKFK